MSSIIGSIKKTRKLLDYPLEQKPSDADLYDATILNVQHLYNRLVSTNEAWAIDEKILRVDPSGETFTLSTDDSFGKILGITTKSDDPNHVERQIQFFDVQNMPFDWNLPNSYTGWYQFFSPGEHSAERMAVFYDKAGSLKIQIRPKPSQAAEYLIKFSLGNWAEYLDLGARPILAQFHNIFEIRTAKDVLYKCEWEGLTREETIEKRAEIRGALNEMEARFTPEFDKHIREMTQDKIVFKKPIGF